METVTGKWASIFGMIAVFFTLSSIGRGQNYYVQPGDTLHKIAARYGASVKMLQQNNNLKTTVIYPGQALSLSRRRTATPQNSTYTVRPGDSLAMLAKRYQVSISVLQAINNLSANYVAVGQRLTIPAPYHFHQVQTGESLYLISQKHGVTVEMLQQVNQLSGTSIWRGQILKIPLQNSGISQPGCLMYIVKHGEPLYLIAKRHGISIKVLLEANHLSYVSAISPGQRLLIPKPTSNKNDPVPRFNLSQSDLDLLARLVSAESAGEPFQGQVAVAATILNRLEDPRYPNTIPGVVYQVESGRYQYSPVLDGRINLPATPGAYQAIEQALTGADPSNGANGFYNPAKTTNQWVRMQPVTATIGGHVFFKY
jgi:N-acetylmuramoyl-L-alanine amidase